MNNVMEKAVNISSNKKNVLEFDIEMTGVDESDMEVRFIIEGDGIELGFDSKKISDNTWSVEIPAMKILDIAQYPYYISVIVDGYAFRGISGAINILASSIKASEPVNKTIKAPKAAKKVDSKSTTKETKLSIKPRKKATKPQPLKVKDTDTVLNELLPKKSTKNTISGLDASIIKTIEKAKGEVKQKTERNKKDIAKKKELLDDNISKIIDRAEDEIDKKKRKDKNSKAKEVKEVVLSATENIIVEDDKPEITETFSAKQVASDLIKSVTGIGHKKATTGSPIREAKEKAKADKVKEILTLESSKKTNIQQKEVGAKKIIRGKNIVEVDTTKETKIKEALNEDDEFDKRSITTTPINKTVH